MSLFSGFSTAEDEHLAMRLSRAMTEKTDRVMARAIRLHRPSNPLQPVDIYATPDGKPVRLCAECLKPWPCATYTTLTAEEEQP